jgi:hypothetical protein
MKKYLKDLTFDEVKDVLLKNDELFDRAKEKAIDDSYYWLEEYLFGARRLKGVDYSIGYDRGDYFTIKDMTSDVLDWIKGVSEDYGLFNEDLVKDAERCNRMYEFLQYGDFEDQYWVDLGLENEFEGKSEDEVYDEYEELKKDIEYRIFKRLQSEISYWYTTPDNQLAGDFADFMDEFFIEDYDDTVVDMETGELIDLNDFDENERNSMDPDQFKLPGFDD